MQTHDQSRRQKMWGNQFRGVRDNYVIKIHNNFIWKIIPPKTKLKTLILNHTHGADVTFKIISQ